MDTAARSGFQRITDGTNTAAVKAASTAPVATDPALVVAISPNSTLTASNPSVGSNNAAIPTSSTQVGGSDGTNLQAARVFDADSGAGSQYVLGTILRKSASGGSVEAGTSSDPLRVDPTGTTAQPVTDNGGSLTVDGTVTVTQATAANLNATAVQGAGSGVAGTFWTVRVSDGSSFVTVATDRTTAAAPFAVRLSDGTSFYTAPAAAQLPSSLVGGRLDTNVGAWLGSTAPTVGSKTSANSIPVVIASDQTAVTAKSEVQIDYDTGAGTQSLSVQGIALPASGGAVAGGTSTNPIRIDPTGTTTQPVSDAGGSLTIDTTQLPASLVGGRLDNNIGAWLGSTAPTVGQKTSANSVPIVIASDQSAVPVSQNGTWTVQQGSPPWQVAGPGAAGAAVTGNPVIFGGSDGTNARYITVDTSGRQVMVGPSAAGAAVAGNPVLVGGSDGTNARFFSVDTSGRLNVNLVGTGGASFGSAFPSTGTAAGYSDGTNMQAARVFDADSGAGTQYVLGAILRKSASGGSVEAGTSSDPLRVDPTGTTAQPVTDNGGSLTVDGTVTANQGTAAAAGAPWSIRLSDGSAFYDSAKTGQLPSALVGGRLDANVGAWLGSTAPTIGQKTMANSVPVAVASDNGLALDATLTGGTQKAIVRGGAKGATTAADVTSTAEGANNQALDVQIYHGGTAKDPTAIRALTSSDVVTAAQGTAAALSSAWPVKITDGTNTHPTADAAARAAFYKLTDGTNTTAVKAASTAAAAVDPSAVVALSPNSPLPTGTNTIGSVTGPGASGSATVGNPVRVAGSDGTNTRNVLTDTSGRVRVVGAAADGAVVTGDPVLIAGTDGTNVRTMLVDSSGNASVAISAQGLTSFSPDPQNDFTGSAMALQADASGNLQVRGQVLSDEGSMRDDFNGSSLTTALTGTLTFTNGSTTVTGSGTAFLAELSTDNYIKKTADSETLYTLIESIDSDTQITLVTPYGGTTASTTAVKSRWATTTPGGGSITVANSLVNLLPGTANASVVSIQTKGDYLPYSIFFRASISQRIANQTTVIGFQDSTSSPQKQAVIVFDGTSNSTLKFRTSSSSAAADTQETTVTLATNATTAQYQDYQIDLSASQATLSINGTIAATHSYHLPGPYDNLSIVASVTNSAVVTATTLSIDSIFFQNLDQLQISNSFSGEPLKVQVVAATTNVAGFAPGYVSTAATTLVSVRGTTYTEQTTNFQGSVVSSSANDAAAGTGARSIKITYYDQTGTGPFSETVTLNGTTAVNLVNTNHCYIESIEVASVGTSPSNAGTITLKAGLNNTGTTVGTIAVGDNRTFWSHHYTPSGKITYITGVSCGHNGTTVGSGALFVIRTIPIGVSNAVEKQITDFIRLYGQSSTFSRNYGTPIQISGPARITMYTTPETSSATIYRGAFDYYDQ
jgi:uncharacterized membrane protein